MWWLSAVTSFRSESSLRLAVEFVGLMLDSFRRECSEIPAEERYSYEGQTGGGR